MSALDKGVLQLCSILLKTSYIKPMVTFNYIHGCLNIIYSIVKIHIDNDRLIIK